MCGYEGIRFGSYLTELIVLTRYASFFFVRGGERDNAAIILPISITSRSLRGGGERGERRHGQKVLFVMTFCCGIDQLLGFNSNY